MTGKGATIRAVLFDVDGTLYLQPPIRRRMAVELIAESARRPRSTARAIRILRSFRRIREELRGVGRPSGSLDDLQYSAPAARLAVDVAEVRATVDEWIHRRPLRHLRACRRPDLLPALDRLHELGIPIGVFSDYPAEAKLAALDVESRFEVLIAATDPEVNAFKPHAAGFLQGARRLGAEPGETLYVGDRADVDRDGALAAGVRAALVGSSAQAAPDLPSLFAAYDVHY